MGAQSRQRSACIVRVEGLYQFNADWNALVAESYQNMEADGVFAEMAANSVGQPLPDLSVQLFNPGAMACTISPATMRP
jgi:hypothetical protein